MTNCPVRYPLVSNPRNFSISAGTRLPTYSGVSSSPLAGNAPSSSILFWNASFATAARSALFSFAMIASGVPLGADTVDLTAHQVVHGRCGASIADQGNLDTGGLGESPADQVIR